MTWDAPVQPIPTRRARVTVRRADRNGRRNSLGRVQFAYDGTRVTASRNNGDVLYEGTATAARATGREQWRFDIDNGDTVIAVVGCGCSSR